MGETKENLEQKNKIAKKFYIAIVIIIIAVLSCVGIIYYLKSIVIETRLKPNPNNYYSESSNYIIYNNKIYYYSIDTQSRGRIYSMNFDGSKNTLISSSELLKTPEFLYAYQGNVYCTSQKSATPGDTRILKINLTTGEMVNIQESELPIPNSELEDLEAEYRSISDEHSAVTPTKTLLVGNKVIFDYDCNSVSRDVLKGIAIYDTQTEEYKEYRDIHHFDIDRDNNLVYLVDGEYNVTTINL